MEREANRATRPTASQKNWVDYIGFPTEVKIAPELQTDFRFPAAEHPVIPTGAGRLFPVLGF
jgi:hypothetical protein